MKPFLVLCLGNEILADDAFGFHVAEALSGRYGACDSTEIEFASIAGFSLLVDTILTGNFEPGYLHFFRMGYDAPTTTLVSSHQISLPTALQFGKMLGLEMPDEVDILAVEAYDLYTLTQSMSRAVEDSVIKAVLRIDDWIRDKKRYLKHQEEGTDIYANIQG
jgi:hydrogenase maturation protease